MKNKSVCVCVKYIYTDNIYIHTDMQLCGVYVYLIYTHKIYIHTDTYIHAYIYAYALFIQVYIESICKWACKIYMYVHTICIHNTHTHNLIVCFHYSHKSLPNDQNLISLCLFNTILSSIIYRIKHS